MLCVGQFSPARGEKLHPVVVVRVVRRGHHCARRVVGRRQPGHGRRGGHAEVNHLCTVGGQAGAQRLYERGSRLARVSGDVEARGTENGSGGRPDVFDIALGELVEGPATDAVGTETQVHEGQIGRSRAAVRGRSNTCTRAGGTEAD